MKAMEEEPCQEYEDECWGKPKMSATPRKKSNQSMEMKARVLLPKFTTLLWRGRKRKSFLAEISV